MARRIGRFRIPDWRFLVALVLGVALISMPIIGIILGGTSS